MGGKKFGMRKTKKLGKGRLRLDTGKGINLLDKVECKGGKTKDKKVKKSRQYPNVGERGTGMRKKENRDRGVSD